MSTLTKEWLLKTIAELEEERDAVPGVVNEDAANALAAMKLALASLEAEPVSVIKIDHESSLIKHVKKVVSETKAPPAQVLPDLKELEAILDWILMLPCPTPKATHFAKRLAVVIDTCRAAMLQGAEPVTTAYKLPANTPCKDAPEHIWLQTAGVWPENGEFSELTWCSDNQHTGDTLYVRADIVADNSPVVPDGYALVPVEPTEDMIVNGFESEPDESFSDEKVWEEYDAMSGCQQAAHRAKLCWAAMLAAAPKPEVK